MSNFTNNNVTPSGEDDNGNYISNSTAFEINEILLPKIAAFCSMVGSTIIITEVLRDWKHERRTGKGVGAVSRTLFFMSISDFIFSFSWFIAGWVVTGYEDFERRTEHPTQNDCRFQAFIGQLGFGASLFFNASLALIYLCIVRYEWTLEKTNRVFQPVAIVIWTVSLAIALVPLVLNLYHDAGPICWIASDGRSPPWVVMLHLLPIWTCILLDMIVFVLIYRTMQRMEQGIFNSVTATMINPSALSLGMGVSPISEGQEDEEEDCNEELEAGNLISREGSSDQNIQDLRVSVNSRSRVVAVQGMWYIGGFLLTFGPQTISVLIFLGTGEFLAPVYRMSYFFFALQGVWNFLIFSRGKRKMKTWVGKRVKRVVWGGLCCQFYQHARKEVSRESAGNAHFSGPSSNLATPQKSSVQQWKKSERIWSWFARSNDPTEVHDNPKGTIVVSSASTVICTNGTAFNKEVPQKAPQTTLELDRTKNKCGDRRPVEPTWIGRV